jgi:hypothetical protein
MQIPIAENGQTNLSTGQAGGHARGQFYRCLAWTKHRICEALRQRQLRLNTKEAIRRRRNAPTD